MAGVLRGRAMALRAPADKLAPRKQFVEVTPLRIRPGLQRAATLAAALLPLLAACGQSAAPRAPKHEDPRPISGFTLRQAGHLPAPAEGLAAAAQDGSVLIFGGLGPQGSLSAIYMLQGGRLSAAGQLPVAAHDLAAAPLPGGGILVAGGGQVASFDSIYRYRNGRVSLVGRLPTPRSDVTAVPLAGKVYLFGGYTGASFVSTILALDGRGRATVAGELPLGLRYVGAAALGGSVYIFGGLAVAGYQDAIYRFTPGHGVTRVGSLPVAVRAPLVAAGQGGILIAGGESAPGRDQAGVYWYAGSGSPRAIGRLPAPIALGAVVYLGHDRFELIGGEDGQQLAAGIFTLQLRR